MTSCGVADGAPGGVAGDAPGGVVGDAPGGVVGDAPGGASIQSMSMKSPSGVAWRSRR
jgi:hypothetical protein